MLDMNATPNLLSEIGHDIFEDISFHPTHTYAPGFPTWQPTSNFHPTDNSVPSPRPADAQTHVPRKSTYPLVELSYDEFPRGKVGDEYAIGRYNQMMQGRQDRAEVRLGHINRIKRDIEEKKRLVVSWAKEKIKAMMISEARKVGWSYWDSSKDNKLEVKTFANIGQAYVDMSVSELESGGYRQMHGICYRIFVENGSFSSRMEAEFMADHNLSLIHI